MKEYLRTCRIATEGRMLLQLQNRQHFVENSNMYSMQDLMDVNSNLLLDELVLKVDSFRKHIKIECPVSQLSNRFPYTSLFNNSGQTSPFQCLFNFFRKHTFYRIFLFKGITFFISSKELILEITTFYNLNI